MTRARRVCYALAAAMMFGAMTACGSDSGPAVNTVPGAVPGSLAVRLTSPNTDDGAIVVVVSGPGLSATSATAPAGLTLHQRLNGGEVTAALFGTVGTGELFRVAVPDVGAASRYTVRIVEVADRANAMRADLGAYRVSIER